MGGAPFWLVLLTSSSILGALCTVSAEKYQAFTNRAAFSTEHLESQLDEKTQLYGHACGHVNECQMLKPPSDLVVAMTQSPFLYPGHGMQGHLQNISDVGVGVFSILPVRNPLDNYVDWVGWLRKHSRGADASKWSLAKFLEHWRNFHVAWQDTELMRDQPKFIFRYEDMDDKDVRGRIFHRIANEIPYTDARTGADQVLRDMLGVMSVIYDARVVHEDGISSQPEDPWLGYRRHSVADIQMAIDMCHDHLKRFGYLRPYQLWLKAKQLDPNNEKPLNALHRQFAASWAQFGNQNYSPADAQ
ncbi:uncharacterized protein MONBRDRAFT_30178 [Monosiga brevicollis MX1]|uniref:Sulfotransferase domain-containing protein n=1 Tax=Monosiga brevicollis TaxID=81824 RepID=A9VD82_MONBE|nr:uncharacterized protein MONBRDRAFT_30178 [Monosiga brevicollis MX1]EDQ84510.1 predicted protein [Monosiga brevicollis MX1]|eukprot:XP_001750697.1 hypothetical protein [Monosiga brevicollis MX1]